MLRRPGSSWGFCALLKGLTSVVVLKVKRALHIHSPHLQFLPARDSNPQPRFTSPTLYPLGHDCWASFLSIMIINIFKQILIGFLSSLSRSFSLRSPLTWHTQSHRSRLHPGSGQIRARPRRPRPLQCPGTRNLRPTQAQILSRGAEAAAHDQEGAQDLHSRWPEGKHKHWRLKHRGTTESSQSES